MPRQYVLPDLLSLCPFPSRTNPRYEDAVVESGSWLRSHNIFTDKRRATFAQFKIELLVSYAYPYADYEQYRMCCDFTNLLFVIDDLTDDKSASGVRESCDLVFGAMSDADWDASSVLEKLTKEFRDRYIILASDYNFQRFLAHFKDYMEAVCKEAELRERGELLTIADYLPLRRENSAIRLSFKLAEFSLRIDIPDEVFANDVFMSLYLGAADMICWSNDVYSYNVEQAKGHTGNNIVTLLRNEKNIDIQAAADYVGVQFGQLMDRFMADKARLPSFGPALDVAVARYVDALGQWVIANLMWSFDSHRYFGANHAEIKRTRIITLGPKEEPEFHSDDSDDE